MVHGRMIGETPPSMVEKSGSYEWGEGGQKAPAAGKPITATAGLLGREARRSEDGEGPARLPSSNAFAPCNGTRP